MIYCVEDGDDIRELMLYTLKTTGFEAKGFENGEAFWEAVEEELPSLVLLDIMLPGDSGLTILKKLRSQKKTQKIPVIMATAKGTEFDKVTGLDLGADDYLVKPFGMMEMVSRIKAVLRRTSEEKPTTTFQTENLLVDLDRHLVKEGTRRIDLTLKEFDLLTLLLRHPGRVFTRQDILSTVWGECFLGESRTVDVHVGSLRTKLGESGSLIKTVRGLGYCLETNHD